MSAPVEESKICKHHVCKKEDDGKCCICGAKICASVDPNSGVGCRLTHRHDGLCENPELCEGKYPSHTWQKEKEEVAEGDEDDGWLRVF